MSKELIEKLRLMAFESVNNDEATMLHEAADALEVKAAPVGEREAFDQWYREKKGLRESTNTTFINDAFFPYKAFQAGAAYQRQSGVVMPEPNEIHQMAFEEGSPDEEGDGYHFDADEFDVFIQRLLDAIARLNGAGSHE